MKRNRFFERNNYKQNRRIDYIQPPLHFGESNVPLNLFIKSPQKFEITEEQIHKAIRAIYKEKYYSVNEIDKNTLNKCLERMGILN